MQTTALAYQGNFGTTFAVIRRSPGAKDERRIVATAYLYYLKGFEESPVNDYGFVEVEICVFVFISKDLLIYLLWLVSYDAK